MKLPLKKSPSKPTKRRPWSRAEKQLWLWPLLVGGGIGAALWLPATINKKRGYPTREVAIAGHLSPIDLWEVQPSLDGQHLRLQFLDKTSSKSAAVKLWDSQTFDELGSWEMAISSNPRRATFRMDFLPDEKTAIVSTYQSITAKNVSSGSILWQYSKPDQYARIAGISRDGNLVAIAYRMVMKPVNPKLTNYSKTLYYVILDAHTGQKLQTFTALNRDSGSTECVLNRTGAATERAAAEGAATDGAFISGATIQTTTLTILHNRKSEQYFHNFEIGRFPRTKSANEKSANEKSANEKSANEKAPIQIFPAGSYNNSELLSPDGDSLAVVCVYQTTEQEWKARGHQDYPNFSMATKLEVYNTRTGRLSWDYNSTKYYSLMSPSWSADGKLLALTNIHNDRTNTILVFNLQGKLLHTLHSTEEKVRSLAFSPDNKKLYGTAYGKLLVWDLD